jgi:hypothetical protein
MHAEPGGFGKFGDGGHPAEAPSEVGQPSNQPIWAAEPSSIRAPYDARAEGKNLMGVGTKKAACRWASK